MQVHHQFLRKLKKLLVGMSACSAESFPLSGMCD